MQNDLLTALQYHQMGALDEAARIYQGLLDRAPDNADALHLLGVLEHQRGEHRRGAERIERAIALNPGAAPYHANLAEVDRAVGWPHQAAAVCRRALELQPDYPEAANNLGLILLGQGQADEAIAHFRLALRLSPDYAMAWNNLGSALRAKGEKENARLHFRRALAL